MSVNDHTPVDGNRIQALAVALTRWQHAAGDYWPFVCAAPFVSAMEWLEWAGRQEQPRPKIVDCRPPAVLAQAIEDTGADGRIAIFVDLSATSVLPSTAWLNRRGFVVVPIIQRWVGHPAVLDCSRLIDQLIAFSRHCRPLKSPRGVVFVLDGERAGRKGVVGFQTRFDNRYAYSGGLLPSPDDLRRQGIIVVRWVTTSELAADL
ncbi:MAG TPA: hypothetical protein VKT80_01965, partial [Chloroflexota bacterium]|nr:hypothetical protein [Chloroflexota bacterium]